MLEARLEPRGDDSKAWLANTMKRPGVPGPSPHRECLLHARSGSLELIMTDPRQATAPKSLWRNERFVPQGNGRY